MAASSLERVLARGTRTAHRALLSGRQRSRLRLAPHPRAAHIAEAIDRAAADRLEPAERGWVERIEAIRAELEASDEELVVVDHGAGSAIGPSNGRSATRSVGQICRNASKSRRWALLLFGLVRTLRPRTCLELGTSLGISAGYQGAALELNGDGGLTTIEGSEALANVARRNLDRLKLGRVQLVTGRFQDALPDVLAEERRVDYAFIDGHHDRDATISYFGQIADRATPDAVLVFDDIGWSRGMREAWDVVRGDPRVALSVDLFQLGICALGPRLGHGSTFRVAIA